VGGGGGGRVQGVVGVINACVCEMSASAAAVYNQAASTQLLRYRAPAWALSHARCPGHQAPPCAESGCRSTR